MSFMDKKKLNFFCKFWKKNSDFLNLKMSTVAMLLNLIWWFLTILILSYISKYFWRKNFKNRLNQIFFFNIDVLKTYSKIWETSDQNRSLKITYLENIGKDKHFKRISRMAKFWTASVHFRTKYWLCENHIRSGFMGKLFFIDPYLFSKWWILVQKLSKSVH